MALQLLLFFKADSSYDQDIHVSSNMKGFLIASGYISVISNVLSTFASAFMIYNLANIGFRAPQKGKDRKEDIEDFAGRIPESQEELLMKFGAGRDWKWMIACCKCNCLVSTVIKPK